MPKKLIFVVVLISTLTDLWSQAPELSATGDQIYCPQSEISIVETFSITNTSNTAINAIYIQVSSGYNQGSDFLEYKGSNTAITSTFTASSGKLKLNLPSGTTALEIETAVKNVIFRSTNPALSGTRVFSITIGDANYLASTGHFYKYYPDLEIPWEKARDEASTKTYYGLTGYLATLTSLEEAVLCGEQTQGAGWIGGTDEETEGVWKWVTGPEGANGGLVFWNGGVNGTTPNFAYWNTNEPNNTNGGEDYAHITDPSVGLPGSWNDLRTIGEPPGPFQAKGYIVEFGGMPGEPDLKIAAATQIRVASVLTVNQDSRCGTGVVNLSATVSEGEINWYDSSTGGSLLFTGPNFSPNLNTTTTFYVAAEAAGCTNGARKPVQGTVLEPVTVPPQITVENCDEDGTPDGYTLFNLNSINSQITTSSSASTTYYPTRSDAEIANSTSQLDPANYNNQKGSVIYARTQKNNGCYGVTEVVLSVSTTAFPPNFVYTLKSCDTDGAVDGYYAFDLSAATPQMLAQFPQGSNLSVSYYRNSDDALLKRNAIPTQSLYRNEEPDEQLVFVRVEDNSSSQCYGVGPHLKLSVDPIPQFDILNEGTFCSTATAYTLETTHARGNYTYEWTDETGTVIGSNAQITVNAPGIYRVTARNSSCTSVVQEVEVIASEPATITTANVEVSIDEDRNTISIIDPSILGQGDYEFALGDQIGPYQDSPVFERVSPGFKTLYVREKNGCGISSIEIPVLGFPAYFTPNNDGFHDTWSPQGLDQQLYTNVSVAIFNRFGKLLKSLNGFNQAWDGTSREKMLPSSDYWYQVNLTAQDGSIHEFKGHFTLKR